MNVTASSRVCGAGIVLVAVMVMGAIAFAGSTVAVQDDDMVDPDDAEGVELLGEENVDHEHACLHGDHDDRTPLDPGASVGDAPVVSDTHVIWNATVSGDEGYVSFDADAHFADGPFVFYFADGHVEPVDGEVLERGDVGACDTLDQYVQVEVPDDGQIDLEISEDGATDGPAERIDIDTPDAVAPGDEVEFDVTMADAAVGEVVVDAEDGGVDLSVVDADGDEVGAQSETSVEFIDVRADNSTYTLALEVGDAVAGNVTIEAATGDNVGSQHTTHEHEATVEISQSPVEGISEELWTAVTGDGELTAADLDDAVSAYQREPSNAQIDGVRIELHEIGLLIQYYQSEDA